MDLSLPPFLELVPASTEVPSLEMVPWNTWTYLCHHFWSWFLPLPRFHLWRWFLEIHGPISGAGSCLYRGSIPGDGSLKYMDLSLPPFLELVPQITRHQLQSWFPPFLKFHLWRWFLEIHGSISAIIFGAGSRCFQGSISGDGSLKDMDLSLKIFLELVPAFPRFHLWRWFIEIHGPISATVYGAGSTNNKASIPELVHAFSKVPPLEMIPWNTWSYLCQVQSGPPTEQVCAVERYSYYENFVM